MNVGIIAVFMVDLLRIMLFVPKYYSFLIKAIGLYGLIHAAGLLYWIADDFASVPNELINPVHDTESKKSKVINPNIVVIADYFTFAVLQATEEAQDYLVVQMFTCDLLRSE